jgi:uncharacterized membrane protein YraQ (UPF0718 family)
VDFIKIKKSFFKSLNSFKQILPMLFGIVLLIGILIEAIPKSFYLSFFRGSALIDPLLGAVLGSISAGSPVTSYIIGGELVKQGVSLIAVTAFIITWVNVGFIQLSIEAKYLGKRFAISRICLSFITSLVVAFLTVVTLSYL